MERRTVVEIERAYAGAVRRRAASMNLLSWQTANLMNATGNFQDTPVEPAQLFDSLEPLWRDARWPLEESPYLVEDEEDALEDARAVSEAMVRAGLATTGRLTPEELTRQDQDDQ